MIKTKLTLPQIEQYLSKAAWILKGPVDAADFKVYIFPLLFFKRISDVYDEEFNAALQDSDGDKAYLEVLLHYNRLHSQRERAQLRQAALC